MDSSVQVSKRIKLSKKIKLYKQNKIKFNQLTKQLIKNKIIKDFIEQSKNIIESLSTDCTIDSVSDINYKLQTRINICDAKETTIQSKLDKILKQTKSLINL